MRYIAMIHPSSASVFNSSKNNSIKFAFAPGQSQLDFSSTGPNHAKLSSSMPQTKTFCIDGSAFEGMHYFIPRRLNFDELDTLIERDQYFLLRGPLQCGKTSAIEEYVHYLKTKGHYRVVRMSLNALEGIKDDAFTMLLRIGKVLKDILESLPDKEESVTHALQKIDHEEPLSPRLFSRLLEEWAEASPKPIILFIDDLDSLDHEVIIGLLHHIRSGFMHRPTGFPQSMCLIGLHSMRNYRTTFEKHVTSAASFFNITAQSFKLGNFSIDETKILYEQHTWATGQQFTVEAIDYAYYLTQGQPLLINALAKIAADELIDRRQAITKNDIEQSKELLIAHNTHLDYLVTKLNDPKVKKVLKAINNRKPAQLLLEDEDEYVRELGFVSRQLDIANPIYEEVVKKQMQWN